MRTSTPSGFYSNDPSLLPFQQIRLEQGRSKVLTGTARRNTAPCTARRCHRRRMRSTTQRTAGSRGRTIHRRHPRSLHSKRRRLGRSRRYPLASAPGPTPDFPGRRRTPQRTARLEGDAQTATAWSLTRSRLPAVTHRPDPVIRPLPSVPHGRRRSVRRSAVCPRLRAPSRSAARVPPSADLLHSTALQLDHPSRCLLAGLAACSNSQGTPRPLRQTLSLPWRLGYERRRQPPMPDANTSHRRRRSRRAVRSESLKSCCSDAGTSLARRACTAPPGRAYRSPTMPGDRWPPDRVPPRCGRRRDDDRSTGSTSATPPSTTWATGALVAVVGRFEPRVCFSPAAGPCVLPAAQVRHATHGGV